MGTPIGLRWDRPATISVDVYPDADAKAWQARDPDHRYLRGSFSFAGDTFEHAGFSGDAVNQEKQDKFDQMQATDRISTDQQLAETLARLDAKFGPDRRAEFIAQLDLPRFARALGTIEKSAVDFTTGLHSDPSYNFRARWTVRLRTRQGQKGDCFIVLFEPFGGQVESVIGHQPVSRDVCAGL
jgi:hypothetical protein